MTSHAYRLTNVAEQELGELLLFIAERDGVDRALDVHSKFAETFDRFARMPAAGSTRPHLTGDGVRWRVVFNWLVIYEPASTPITILRIIHGSREVARFLETEDEL